jgi:hypothetical protein
LCNSEITRKNCVCVGKFAGKMSHFKLINSLKVNDEIPVKKYQSSETGIVVYVAQVNSPLTNAYIALGKFLSLIIDL